MNDASPEALLRELERARVALHRADRNARSYLVEQGVLDQAYLDVAEALRRLGRNGSATVRANR